MGFTVWQLPSVPQLVECCFRWKKLQAFGLERYIDGHCEFLSEDVCYIEKYLKLYLSRGWCNSRFWAMLCFLLITGDVAITFVHNNGNHDSCMVKWQVPALSIKQHHFLRHFCIHPPVGLLKIFNLQRFFIIIAWRPSFQRHSGRSWSLCCAADHGHCCIVGRVGCVAQHSSRLPITIQGYIQKGSHEVRCNYQ